MSGGELLVTGSQKYGRYTPLVSLPRRVDEDEKTGLVVTESVPCPLGPLPTSKVGRTVLVVL